ERRVEAGVVDQDVDAAVALDDLVREALHVLLGGDVRADPLGWRVQVGDRDRRALAFEPVRDRAADPLRAARYDRNLAPEAAAHRRGENAVGTRMRFCWVWMSGWIFARNSCQRSSAWSRARRASRSPKLSYRQRLVYVERLPMSVVKTPTRPPRISSWIA